MTTPIVPISDQQIAALVAECRLGADEHGGMGHEEESALYDRLGDTLEQMKARLRAAEARLEFMINERCVVDVIGGLGFFLSWPELSEEQISSFETPHKAIDAAMERTP